MEESPGLRSPVEAVLDRPGLEGDVVAVSDRATAAWTHALVLVPLALSAWVYLPVTHVYFWADDFLNLIDLVARDRLDLVRPIGGHSVLVWRVVCLIAYSLFGIRAEPHLCLILATGRQTLTPRCHGAGFCARRSDHHRRGRVRAFGLRDRRPPGCADIRGNRPGADPCGRRHAAARNDSLSRERRPAVYLDRSDDQPGNASRSSRPFRSRGAVGGPRRSPRAVRRDGPQRVPLPGSRAEARSAARPPREATPAGRAVAPER